MKYKLFTILMVVLGGIVYVSSGTSHTYNLKAEVMEVSKDGEVMVLDDTENVLSFYGGQK